MKKPLIYLKDELNGKGDFLKEWKGLSIEDKDDLKQWASEEMKVLSSK